MFSIYMENVSKSYKMYRYLKGGIKDFIFNLPKSLFDIKHGEYEVLKNISLYVKYGEGLGIVGRNGSGKSTLLMLIAGVLKPDTGKIKVNGKVIPLLELGAGFHPELTGMENIFLNGILLGYDKHYIKSRVDDIIQFSELGEFIYQPVKFYSSGMLSRLGFSVAAFLEGEIILIDEILAVGDMQFQIKSKNKIKELKSKGASIVLVSHSFDDISFICDRAIYLQDKQIVYEGLPEDIMNRYMV